MLGIVVLAVAFSVTFGLIAAATARRKRDVGGHLLGRPHAFPAALAITLVLPGVTSAAAPPAEAAPSTAAAPHAAAPHAAAPQAAALHDAAQAAAPQHAAPHAGAAAPATAPAGAGHHTTTVRYGPLLLPPYLGGAGGHEEPGAHSGHAGQMMIYAAPTYDMPCHNCYITGIQPDLVYADGSRANYDTGAMLHHMVLFDPTKDDTTCGRQGVGLVTGQRVFAAGNERTGAQLPPGYGYPVGLTPFGAMAELMNMTAQPQQVYVTMTINWVDAAEAQLKEVTPVWLDVDNCGDSQYTIPAGPSHTTWTWKSTMSGDIVAVGGHVHDQGVSITLSNATRNEKICESVAGYPGGSHHEGHVESMSTCIGDPVATVRKGDELMLDSYYHAAMPDDTVMGIMIAYLHQF
ncbi:MAG TPA: hypothetical protein VHH34_22820 [Pseudonocardiaceae bacterium]|nr:hypothetical protein [Pseudonocardiaceae bacterium]